MKRQKKDYLKQAAIIALKSGCVRAKRGAVLVLGGKVLVKAFNRVYPVNNFCQKHGCLRDKLKLGLGKDPHICRAIHAEALAVATAARKGVALKAATAYITGMTCMNCAKLFAGAGIRRVIYLDVHGDVSSVKFLKAVGIDCQRGYLARDNPAERLRDTTGQ